MDTARAPPYSRAATMVTRTPWGHFFGLSGFRVQGLGLRVLGFVVHVLGLGFRDLGLGFSVILDLARFSSFLAV